MTRTVATCVSWLVAGVAHAQPGAPADGTAMETYRLEARAAALRGDCKQVGTIARLVADVDAPYYRDVFLRDAVVVSCNGGVGGVPLPPSAVAPSPTTHLPPLPSQEPARNPDSGRGALGFLAGIGAGAALGAVGVMIAGTIADNLHPDCASFCGEVVIPAVIGGQIGLNLGLALGTTLVGNHRGGHGSFATSFTVGLLGSGASWLFALNDETIDNGMFGVAFFLLPVVGATSGYWLTHEHTGLTVVPTGSGVSAMGRF